MAEKRRADDLVDGNSIAGRMKRRRQDMEDRLREISAESGGSSEPTSTEKELKKVSGSKKPWWRM